MTNFKLQSQLTKELEHYFRDNVQIVDSTKDEIPTKTLTKETQYSFNQKETLDTIDLYYNSKFKSGELDSEGMRKTFLNICKFRSDVASKQIDLDTKDFLFVPEETSSVWPSFFMQHEFRAWVKDNGLGELINEIIIDLPKYGSAVVKVVKGVPERVPINTIRIQQDAKDIDSADFFILEHANMRPYEILPMSEWKTDDLDFNFTDKVTIYERYGRVPKKWLAEFKGDDTEGIDERETVDTMSIVMKGKKGKTDDSRILFIEKIDERPFEEVHWLKIDGRWLGIGEIENQIPNQRTRNMIANLRRRSLHWSSKKIFQSTDTEIARNLVREVRDGEVLQIQRNGNITPVNVQSQSLAEFQSTEDVWEKNSNQKSFTFEVATGESLPSGTPFRLGVLLTNAANSHFGLKRENLGLFWKRVFMNHVVPSFKRQIDKERLMAMHSGEEGFELLKEKLKKVHFNKKIKQKILNLELPNVDKIKSEVEEKLNEFDNLFFKLPENFYKNIKYKIDLVITGESTDVRKEVESLANLYNLLAQQGDPRAEKVLSRAFALTGVNLNSFGTKPEANQPQQELIQSLVGKKSNLNLTQNNEQETPQVS